MHRRITFTITFTIAIAIAIVIAIAVSTKRRQRRLCHTARYDLASARLLAPPPTSRRKAPGKRLAVGPAAGVLSPLPHRARDPRRSVRRELHCALLACHLVRRAR